MFRIEKISSLDLPELVPYRTMRRPLEHERQGIFVAEGEKVVRRLLESRFEVVSVLLPEKHLEAFRPLLEARPEKLTVYLADKKLLESLVGFSMYQGQLAVGRVMVQVQSSWFPLVDRNPQTFVDIATAKPGDFHPATHRVYRAAEAASCISVQVLPPGGL